VVALPLCQCGQEAPETAPVEIAHAAATVGGDDFRSRLGLCGLLQAGVLGRLDPGEFSGLDGTLV
jgi:hypothetical protein